MDQSRTRVPSNPLARRPIGRRAFIASAIAATAVSPGFPRPAIAQARTKIRIGHPLGLSNNTQMWAAVQLDAWAKHGLEPEFFQFTTGLELFQAMIGGSLDVLTTGAVLENFPAQGQGKVFLFNCLESNSSSLWVRTDKGVGSFADLKGKQISTTRGTTADYFLARALEANGIGEKDVEIVNQRMNEAVTSFIAGAVPAVALWFPFNMQVQKQVPGAKRLISQGDYFPAAAVPTGWATTEAFLAKSRDALVRLVRAWADGNEAVIKDADPVLAFIQNRYIRQSSLEELRQLYSGQKMYPVAEWRKVIEDGTATSWLNEVTKFFAKSAPIANPIFAEQYFDRSVFLEATKA